MSLVEFQKRSIALPFMPKVVRDLSFFSLCLFLTACTREKLRVDLDAGIPDKYVYHQEAKRKSGEDSLSMTQTAPSVSSDWAEMFRSPELSAIVAEAAANNLDVAQAVARIMQADAIARATSSVLYPNLSGQFGLTRSTSSSTQTQMLEQLIAAGTSGSTVPTSAGLSFVNQVRPMINASYVLDLWGKNRAAAERDATAAIAARFDRDVVMIASTTKAADTYFQILGLQDRLRITRHNVKVAASVLEAIQTRFNVGTASVIDVAQQESVLAQQRAIIPSLEQALQAAKVNLATYLGHPVNMLKLRGTSLKKIALPKIEAGIPSQLLLRRPDIAEAEANLFAAHADIHVARASFFPSVTFTGYGGWADASLKTLISTTTFLGSITSSIVQTIFDGGALKASYDQAKGKYELMLQRYRASILKALSDVEIATINIRQSTENERATSAYVQAADKVYQASLRQLNEGTIDIVILARAQSDLFSAQSTLAQVKTQRMQAYLSLIQALGGGWSKAERLASAEFNSQNYPNPSSLPLPAQKGTTPTEAAPESKRPLEIVP